MAIGQKWEGKAFFKYKQIAERERHVNLSVEKCGLFVSKEGVLGASLDGIISCDCHVSGVLKIKCAASFWTKDPNYYYYGEVTIHCNW